MMKFSCPHCLKPGISFLAKLYIGPKKPARCRQCGKGAFVSDRLAILSLAPFFAGLVFALFFEPGAARYGCALSGFLVYAVSYSALVPLIVRERP